MILNEVRAKVESHREKLRKSPLRRHTPEKKKIQYKEIKENEALLDNLK